MKSVLLSVLFLMMPVFLLAQDGKDKKTLLDSLENPTVKDNYTYYKIVKNHNIPSDSYEIRNYYRSGKLYAEGKTTDSLGFNKTGKFITYYENGNKKAKKVIPTLTQQALIKPGMKTANYKWMPSILIQKKQSGI